MTEANASNIYTHYYKLAHINTINYTILSSKFNNDQQTLELELIIRNKHPKILLTYYNKNLYYFTFGHSESEIAIGLISQYPNLEIKYSGSTSCDKFANPPKINYQTSDENEEHLAFANLSFLKAVKKMILYNLSLQGIVQIFGNYCVYTKLSNSKYSILCIDPILFPNGDLLISCIEKHSIQLYPSSIVYSKDHTDSEVELNYVIYIIPSGIRCHLFDTENFKNNIVETPPLNDVEKLNNLIHLCTGVEDISTNTVWIKLIPNLKHLNNQTSSISKFIHQVDNKKFILWPWDLCLLQFGKYEPQESTKVENVSVVSNPIDLISEFIDFQIENKSKIKQDQQDGLDKQVNLKNSNNGPFSIQSNRSTGEGSIANALDGPRDINSLDLNMNTPMGTADLFNLQNTNEFFTNEPIEDSKNDVNNTEIETKDDEEMDDLFGSDDSEDETKEDPIVNENDNLDKTFQEQPSFQDDFKENESLAKQPSIKPSYIDILKNQMTIKKNESPDYKDPGAPLPIIPTPYTQTNTAPPTTSITNSPSSISEPAKRINDSNNNSNNTSNDQKSAFSPILFNPIIKSDIDKKYGLGGKFYVDKDAKDSKIVDKKKTVRATSVSGQEISFSRDDKRKLRLQMDAISSSSEDDNLSENIDDDDDNESDEDEDVEMKNSTPLKLNDVYHHQQSQQQTIESGNISSDNPNVNISESQDKPQQLQHHQQQHTNQPQQTSSFGSPIGKFKPDSPQLNELQPSMSPAYFDNMLLQTHQSPPPHASTMPDQKNNIDVSPSKQSETQNYLPLILRSVNISSIPDSYIMNNLSISDLTKPPSFAINDDFIDTDLDSIKSNEMIIKSEYMKEFLSYLSSNIIFDMGLNRNVSHLDNYHVHKNEKSSINYEAPSNEFTKDLQRVFPVSYNVKVIEFLQDRAQFEDNNLDNQMNFLNDMINDADESNPKTQFENLKKLEWHALNDEYENVENFQKYYKLINSLTSNNERQSKEIFKLPLTKSKVMKNENIVNLNTIGLEFWKFLNFSPINKKKPFQILLISEHGNYNYANTFLDQLINNYRECNFGDLSRLNLSTVETRSDLEPISNGLLLLNHDKNQSYNDFYVQLDKKLSSVVELIRLDLINKTTNFEFDRPLLLLFVNFNKNLNSTLQICKIFRNFKVALMKHQLSLVPLFTKIIPSDFILKQVNEEINLKVFSNYKYSKLSMNLYNECPCNSFNKEIVPNNIFTTLVREPPHKIQFKFMNAGLKDKSFERDIFLHLAYERSIDKNWFAAAWSDPLGLVTHTKSWYCSNNQSPNQSYNGNSFRQNDGEWDLNRITDDIFHISNELLKTLIEETNDKVHTGNNSVKKFLVLTRINSIIPDDELIHWKRLSIKSKDVSLIVLSVNQTPNLLFSEENLTDGQYSTNSSPSSSAAPSTTALLTSPNGLNFHSPQSFFSASANFLSPQDLVTPAPSGTSSANNPSSTSFNDSDSIIQDPEEVIFGTVPKTSLPSFNSPTRAGMKIGYLLKEWEVNNGKRSYLVFEINLLSCSNYWDLDVLMKLLISQYRKLIVLNDILCMRRIDGRFKNENKDRTAYRMEAIVPWHIHAVGKLLNYLVHIHVEKSSNNK